MHFIFFLSLFLGSALCLKADQSECDFELSENQTEIEIGIPVPLNSLSGKVIPENQWAQNQTRATKKNSMSECAEEVFSLYNLIYGIYPISPDDLAKLVEVQSQNMIDKHDITSYLSEFTFVSNLQIRNSTQLSNNPEWSQGDLKKIKEYYRMHEETQFDKDIRLIASDIARVIVHGNIDQLTLSTQLNRFDIKKLLEEGPYTSSVLSEEAQKLIYDSLKSVERVYDIHLHNLGYDEGNYINPNHASLIQTSWKNYFTFLVLRYAAGISSPKGSTHEARKRMQLYAGHFPKLRGMILPIHKAILPNHVVDWSKTGNYFTDRSALLTAVSFHNSNAELLPAVSVHPFDRHWKEKLISAHKKGIRLIKWMPPQSIPPDSNLLDDYYKTVSKLDMILIAHAGIEHTIPTEQSNIQWFDWGNPLRFRKPLQLGVKVILAHCGHTDPIPDLDHPKQPKIAGYKLFLRLAKEAHQKNQTGEWKGKLYGDLAAVTTHYGPDFVTELMKHIDEPGIRFIYGSDYPFTNLIQPANDAYEQFAASGLLDPTKVRPLQEIRSWNPLLANYVFTKNLELKMEHGKTIRFPEATFTAKFKGAEIKFIDEERWHAYKAHPEGL